MLVIFTGGVWSHYDHDCFSLIKLEIEILHKISCSDVSG
jgi:hypothetical protein